MDAAANPSATVPEQSETVMVVDDSPDNLALISGLLKPICRTRVARDGATAIDLIARSGIPDLILLDVMMPGLDGFEVCRRLKSDSRTASIPVIFLTARATTSDEVRGLALGAADYIPKPVNPPVLLTRVRNHLDLKRAQDRLAGQNAILERRVEERTRQLENLQTATMVAMGALAETRDPETGNHIHRTQHYVRALAEGLAARATPSPQLSPAEIALMTSSAPLHDIGKVGISDSILLKPGKLTPEEFERMKLHTRFGRDAIAAAERSLAGVDNFLRYAKEIAYSHHEKWDGSGYPEGLAGDDIPLSARIMAVADVYDALISRRPYKAPIAHEVAVAIIVAGSGTHFDPALVDVFVSLTGRFREISIRFSD